ncbi:unnamed protein product [Vicia faba]|uniref:Transmembrane protein n=1 Tax=Vicia faba TaxID=3906 RepID=A0AAV0ZPN3_VICFA|nr:unnamed protein product [Vicia faba]
MNVEGVLRNFFHLALTQHKTDSQSSIFLSHTLSTQLSSFLLTIIFQASPTLSALFLSATAICFVSQRSRHLFCFSAQPPSVLFLSAAAICFVSQRSRRLFHSCLSAAAVCFVSQCRRPCSAPPYLRFSLAAGSTSVPSSVLPSPFPYGCFSGFITI